MISFSSALLVGGRSRRMGQDKALLDWHGRPLWTVQVRKLISLGSEKIYLAARREQVFKARIESELTPQEAERLCVVEDPPQEDCGPIGAISRCLACAKMPLIVLAVDLPLMTADFLRDRLCLTAATGKGVFYKGPHGPEVLGALYVPEMLPQITEALRSGANSLQALVARFEKDDRCEVREPANDETHFWLNANTPEEAEEISRFKP